ncbi:MAG TPA: GNAT family N-acetyltransferase [Geminicoccaceae bacterium]|nr:GNAT family N-acetyltransferase [Geminicoccaceae bacterium]
MQRELVERIERAALWAWPPRETAHVDGWLLRAGSPGGRTRRVDSARTLAFAAGADVGKAIGRVDAWYATRGLPACFQLTELSAPTGLDAELEARGYVRLPSVSVLLLDAAAVEPPAESLRIELLTRPTPQVMNAVCDSRWDAATRRTRAELFTRIRRPHVFAVLLEGTEPAAGGLCVVDGDLAGIFTLRTYVPFRGRGHARAVLRRLVAWACHAGAREIYLQVEDDNAPAQALHRPLGAERVYRYWYREAAGS